MASVSGCSADGEVMPSGLCCVVCCEGCGDVCSVPSASASRFNKTRTLSVLLMLSSMLDCIVLLKTSATVSLWGSRAVDGQARETFPLCLVARMTM